MRQLVYLVSCRIECHSKAASMAALQWTKVLDCFDKRFSFLESFSLFVTFRRLSGHVDQTEHP